ncbi:MAG TPA: hypothetical protein VH143_10390 [Kofleriaceae bacterium]|nr:hypothetical protein [Kofleriaceae bacterium]
MRAMAGLVIVVAACGAPTTPLTPPAATPPATPIANAPAPDAAITADPAPPPAGEPVLAWPVAPFTAAQVAEVKACDVDKLAESRYPKSVGIDALAGSFARKTTCDAAALAAACAGRLEDDAAPPASCLDAYRASIKANAAFIYAGGLMGGYFGKVTQVAAPPISARALASVKVDYKWDGLGTGVAWTLNVDALATKPAMRVTGATVKLPAWSAEIGNDLAALGHSLASFVPLAKPLHAVNCYDNYPDWTITLAFDDGSKLELVTNGSNLLGLGGPWQTTIGGVVYMQASPDLVRAVAAIVKVVGMPLGEPEAMTCHGFDLQKEALP